MKWAVGLDGLKNTGVSNCAIQLLLMSDKRGQGSRKLRVTTGITPTETDTLRRVNVRELVSSELRLTFN